MVRCDEDVVKSPKLRSRISSRFQIPVLLEAETPEPLREGPDLASRLIAFDTRFSKWVHEHCLTDLTYRFLRFFEYSGDGLLWLPATAILWILPSALSPETRMFALNLFTALLLDLLVVGAIKSLVRRKRPQYNRGHVVIIAMDHWSFPSGHSTRAVMVVTLAWLYTPFWYSVVKQPWSSDSVLSHVDLASLLPMVKCACVLWMLATASSRVVLGRHYLLDVAGGMIIGVLEALVAHFALHVPLKVSELQHGYLLSLFGVYEAAFWRLFHGRWLVSSREFREMNRQILEADLGPL